MNLFGKEPQERAMACLIHDTNSRIALVRVYEGLIKRSTDVEEIKEYALKIANATLDMSKYLDVYYKKFQNDFK
jgi:hypothetical protein